VPAAAQQAPAVSPYYPLKLGSTWEYQGARNLIVKAARAEKIGNLTCVALEWLVDGNVVALEHVIVTNDGVYRCAYTNKPVTPPLRFLKLPPVAGDSWKINSAIDGSTMVGTFALRQESVTVPAGKFDNAFAASTTDMLVNGQAGLSTTYWFAPGYGLVRQLLKANNNETLFQLAKFEPGK
jgi:hypothetical protein